jgi:hypothetical protein
MSNEDIDRAAMLHKAILALLAVTMIGLAGTTAASARGERGYPTAVAYLYPFSFGSERICHPVRHRVLMRHGWRSCRGRLCS